VKLAILITNPNHHLELTLGLAKRWKEKGDEVKYVSLCEMRRMPSPVETFEGEGLDFVRFAELPGNLKPSSGKKSLGKSNSRLRALVQKAFWLIKLKPFIKASLKDVDKVLLLNDAAFPGDRICRWLKGKKIPFYLMQEGIRFPLPAETEVKYGGGGAEKVLSWGKRSAAHFGKVVENTTEVAVAGSPRFDSFLQQVNSAPDPRGTEKILGVFTNPIDDQGFCSKEKKLALFESLILRSAGYVNQNGITLGLKCHPREDVSEYLKIAHRHVHKVEELPRNIMEAILKVNAGIIMASTVGLELLGAKRPIAQMEIPGFGYVFDYTDDGSVVKIPVEGDFDLTGLFEDKVDLTYFEEHVESGDSVKRMYQLIKG